MLRSSLDPARVGRLLALALLVPFAAGCAAAGHTSSPWQWGGGVRAAPALWDVGESGVTAHPMASWTYLPFDGGHDSLFEFGAQLRKPMATGGGRDFWVGGEATYSYLRTTIESVGFESTTGFNGYSFTALIGLPIASERWARWGPNFYAGAGISDYGAQGWNLRLGIDLQPTFLWEN